MLAVAKASLLQLANDKLLALLVVASAVAKDATPGRPVAGVGATARLTAAKMA